MYKVLVVRALGDLPGTSIKAGDIRGIIGTVDEVNWKFDEIYNRFTEYGFGEVCEIWINEEYEFYEDAYDRLTYLSITNGVIVEDYIC